MGDTYDQVNPVNAVMLSACRRDRVSSDRNRCTDQGGNDESWHYCVRIGSDDILDQDASRGRYGPIDVPTCRIPNYTCNMAELRKNFL